MLSSFYIQNILLCPTYVLLLDWCLRVELNFMLFFVRITKQNPGKTVYSTAHTNFCVSSRVPHYFNLSAYTDSIRQAKEWSYPWNKLQHFVLTCLDLSFYNKTFRHSPLIHPCDILAPNTCVLFPMNLSGGKLSLGNNSSLFIHRLLSLNK